jgi:acyl dehydratase
LTDKLDHPRASTAKERVMTTTVRGLEELKALAGKDLGSSGWLEVTQDRVNTFADATGDHQWIHVDVEKAKSGPFGGPIAHGYLTLSLIVPMFAELLDVQDVKMGVNYGLEKLRFPSPVPVGSRIRLNTKVRSVEEVAGNGVQTQLECTMEVDGSDKPACIAQVLYRHYA